MLSSRLMPSDSWYQLLLKIVVRASTKSSVGYRAGRRGEHESRQSVTWPSFSAQRIYPELSGLDHSSASPRPAEAVNHGRVIRRTFHHPFDRELGIETSRFCQGGLDGTSEVFESSASEATRWTN